MNVNKLLKKDPVKDYSRRTFLQSSAIGAATLFGMTGAFAEELIITPRSTEGPYYPDKLPLDTDNDLVIITDNITPAVGEITHLHGTVTDVKGEPVRGALVEIWQTDCNGSYLHSQGGNRRADNKKDANFQGYGRFLTDRKGRYYFRTIKPVVYPGRTPHIHCAVSLGTNRMLTTQCYINGHAMNANDGVLRGIRDPLVRETVMVNWKPIPNSKIGEFSAKWDIVIGATPEDPNSNLSTRNRNRG